MEVSNSLKESLELKKKEVKDRLKEFIKMRHQVFFLFTKVGRQFGK